MNVKLHKPTPVLRKPRQRLTKSEVPRAAQPGMALTELLVAGVVIAAVLGALTVVSGSLRDDSARDRTDDTLTLLARAMSAYHAEHGADPLPQATPDALAALFADPAASEHLADLALERDVNQRPILRDGFGQTLVYLTPTQRGAATGDFVSAGPDRRFGDPFSPDPTVRRAAADNLYASDREPHQP